MSEDEKVPEKEVSGSPEVSPAEPLSETPPSGDGTIKLSDLVYEGRPVEVKGGIYHVKHPLMLTLPETALSDKYARVFNSLMPKFRGGELSEEESVRLDEVITDFASVVTNVPREVLSDLPWWQRTMLIGLFQTSAPKARTVAATPNRAQRRMRSTSRKD